MRIILLLQRLLPAFILLLILSIFTSFNAQGLKEDSVIMPKKDSLAQIPKKDSLAPKSEKKGKIIWLPVLASSPANGFMFGVAPSSNWLMGPVETTSYSSLLGSFVFTTLKQFLFTMKGNIFSKDNNSLSMVDIRYFVTSQPTYGLGTGPNSSKLASSGFQYNDNSLSAGIKTSQLMNFNFLRIYETYFKKINKGMYVGVGYHLDAHFKIKDQLLKLDTIPPTITSDYAYAVKYGFNGTKYTVSGISANFLFDTRDNTVSPYKGYYALVTLRDNPRWLGSSKGSSTLWTEFRTYINLKKDRPRNLIGIWTYGNFQLGGHLPYLDLPAVGWDQFGRSGRAYPQGRFRGEALLYGETEWRFPLQKDKDKWGGVIFFNATTANNKDAGINMFKYVNTGYGLGLRFTLNEKSRTNLCIDYGFGNYKARGFYLSVNEVF